MTIVIKWNMAAHGHAAGDEEFVEDNDEFVKALIANGRVTVVWEDLPPKPEKAAKPEVDAKPELAAVAEKEPEAATE